MEEIQALVTAYEVTGLSEIVYKIVDILVANNQPPSEVGISNEDIIKVYNKQTFDIDSLIEKIKETGYEDSVKYVWPMALTGCNKLLDVLFGGSFVVYGDLYNDVFNAIKTNYQKVLNEIENAPFDLRFLFKPDAYVDDEFFEFWNFDAIGELMLRMGNEITRMDSEGLKWPDPNEDTKTN